MKISMTFLRTKKFLLLLAILLLEISCSKSPGKTSTKLKLFSGNSFSSTLATSANNGLILYGKSADGQIFTKKIDNDTADIVFPNGTWNFYAVGWHSVSVPPSFPNFSGVTSCGSASVVLNGTDANVSMTLSNAGCNNAAFSAGAKSNTVVDLPNTYLFNCKNIAGITAVSNTLCDQNAGVHFNKGYATSYRIAAFENQNFGTISAPVKIAESVCVRTDYSTLTGMIQSGDGASSDFINLRIPTNLSNGLDLAVEVFYSEGSAGSKTACDPTGGVDVLPLVDGPRIKSILDTTPTVSTYTLYIQTNSSDVCQAPRLGTANFAGGFGTVGSPYAICTKDQFNLLSSNFLTYQTSSAVLLTDIDFAMTTIVPIGDALTTAGGSATNSYTGVFDGGNHKISNFMIDCRIPGGTAENNDVGLFRSLSNATVKNLTLNSSVIMCNSGNNIGLLAGKITNTGAVNSLENLKMHGHTEGGNFIGGVIGYVMNQGSGTLNISSLHMSGDLGGAQNIGGLFGYAHASTGTIGINRSSFRGTIHSNGGSSTPVVSSVGGLIGDAGSVNLSEVIVKAERLEGSTTVGGFIGTSSGVIIANSYVEANIKTYGSTDGSITFTDLGGAIGKSTGGSLANVIAANGLSSSNRNQMSDHTLGGLLGDGTATTCANSFYTGANDGLGPFAACGSPLTTASAKIKISYPSSAFSMATLVGSWDAVANSPVLSPGCSPSDLGKYYEVTTINPSSIFGAALPGDIILCGGSTYALVPILSKNTTLSSFLWSMPDDTFDIPRLSFEAAIENAVPYLKRECSGHYATQLGSGTATDPKWICTYGQFTGMAADPASFYQLKKNIFFEGAAGIHTPLVANDYKLNGNGHGLYNFTMTLPNTIPSSPYNYGIFSQLGSGTNIFNLNIYGAELMGSAVAPVSSDIVNAGLFAGSNLGVVNNVSIEFSKATLQATGVAGSTINFSGFIGSNTGLITKGVVDSSTEIVNGDYPTSSHLYAANVVAVNTGTIDDVKSDSSINRNFNCTTSSSHFSFTPGEVISSFVAYNSSTGTIKEVESQGDFGSMLNQSPNTGCVFPTNRGVFSPFIAINAGIVQDFDVNPKFYFSGATGPTPELFAQNTAAPGSVKRGFVTYEIIDANKIMNQTHTGGLSWDAGALPNPSVTTAGPVALACANAGEYYNVSTNNVSTVLGVTVAVNSGDIVMCDGTNNIVIPAAFTSGIMTAMTDVFYLVRTPTTTPPTLAPGRYFDSVLDFSVTSGFQINDIFAAPVLVPTSSTWAVGTDILNPGTNIWLLELQGGATSSTKTPKLVGTGGGMDQLGAPF